jgi:hypothetical protein
MYTIFGKNGDFLKPTLSSFLAQKSSIYSQNCNYFSGNMLKVITSAPGVNPTSVRYSASVAKIYKTLNSLACFESKIFLLFQKTI